MVNVANLRRIAERRVQFDALKLRGGGRPPPRQAYADTIQRPLREPGEPLLARDGTRLVLRHIRIDDVAALQRFFSRLSPEEVRMRFLHPMNELAEPFARQLCDLNPEVAFAWVLADPDDAVSPPATPEIYGVARAHVDRVLDQAEFAIVIQRRFAHQGFGTLLMHRIMDSSRSLGATELWSDVLIDNSPMLGLCKALGFTRSMTPSSPGILRVSLDLAAAH